MESDKKNVESDGYRMENLRLFPWRIRARRETSSERETIETTRNSREGLFPPTDDGISRFIIARVSVSGLTEPIKRKAAFHVSMPPKTIRI